MRVPGEAVGGVADLGRDAAQTVGGDKAAQNYDKIVHGAEAIGGEAVSVANPALSPVGAYLLTTSMSHKGSYADQLSARDTVGKLGNETVNQATAVLGSLVLGSEGLGAMGILKGAEGLAGAVQGATRFGLASGLLGSVHQERFSNALEALGVHSEFTDWLGSNEGDGPLAQRFKNAVDATLTGAAGEMVFNTAKYAWSVARGVPDAAAKEAAETAAKEVIPEAAQPAPVVTRTAETAAAPEGATKAGEAPSEPEAGTVRFMAKPQGAPDGQYQEVGSMSKADLLTFQKLAQSYQFNRELFEKYGIRPTGSAALDVTEENAPETYAKLGQLTFSPIAQGNLAPTLRALADTLPGIDRPLADEELQRQAGFFAKSLGMDTNRAVAFAQDIAGSTDKIAPAMLAIRTFWANAARQLDTLAAKGPDYVEGLEGDDLTAELNKIHLAHLYGGLDNDIGTSLGRALRARQLPDPATYFEDFGKDESKTLTEDTTQQGASDTITGSDYPLPKNKAELKQFLSLWQATGDSLSEKNDLLRGRMTVPTAWFYLRNSLPNFYTGSILAGRAIIKGWMYPSILGSMRTLERTLGSGIAAINPLVDAETRAQMGTVAKGAPAAYLSAAGQMKTAFQYAVQAMKSGRTIIGGGYSAKDAAQRLGPITEGMLAAAGAKPQWQYSLGNLINFWPRQVFSLIGMHDEFTKRVGYHGEVYAQALLDGAEKALKGDDLADYVSQRLHEAIDPETGAATSPTLLNRASVSSLIQHNDPNTVVGRLISTIDFYRNRIPELRYILPVFDVPAHGLGQALRRIPVLNYAFKDVRDDLAGVNGPIAAAEAHGRMLTGAAALGLGYSLARTMQLTGAGPSDPRSRQIWMQDHQPYSVKMGDHWVSYKDVEPIGGILGIIGSVYDRSVYEPEDKGWQQNVLAATTALADYFKDKGALQQLADVMNFGGSPGEAGSILRRFSGSTMSGFTPAFVKYIRNIDDPTLRQKPTAFDYVLDSLPGASKNLDPVRNVLGEPIHQPRDGVLNNLSPVTIASPRPNGPDPVMDELAKVYDLTGYAPGVTSQAQLLHGFKDSRTVMLENGHSLFDAYMEARMGDSNDPGSSVRQQLADLFDSDAYKEASYGSASSAGDVLGNASKLHMIERVFSDADKQARYSVGQQSETARQYLAAAQVKRMSPDLLGNKSIDDVVHRPEILNALGINLQDFEQ